MNDYRSVLVHVGDADYSRQVLSVAIGIAGSQGAVLSAVHAPELPYLGGFRGPRSPQASALLSDEAMQTRVAKAGCVVADAAQARSIRIDFQGLGGDAVAAMVARARTTDLVVVGQPSEDDAGGPSHHFASQVLVGASCPVLFVPCLGALDRCGSRVLVAWSPTRESARALRDALPMLQRAATVHVRQFGAPVSGSQEPLAGVADYLRAHGVTASCSFEPVREIGFSERMLTPTVVDASVAELLLSNAADMAADLIVMGGYGHTRTHELLLGGVTRTMLSSMTVPVLMSH